MSSPTFTGTQVNYYAVCHRKLWLFTHDIEMERENENVQIGKLVGEQTYSREQKEIAIDEQIRLDWIKLKDNLDGSKTVDEVKKGKMTEAVHHLQRPHYLLFLRAKALSLSMT